MSSLDLFRFTSGQKHLATGQVPEVDTPQERRNLKEKIVGEILERPEFETLAEKYYLKSRKK